MSRWVKRAERPARPDPFAFILEATEPALIQYAERPVQAPKLKHPAYPSGVIPRMPGTRFVEQREALREKLSRRVPSGNSGDRTGMDRLKGIVRPVPHGELGRSPVVRKPRTQRIQARGWGFVRKPRKVTRAR